VCGMETRARLELKAQKQCKLDCQKLYSHQWKQLLFANWTVKYCIPTRTHGDQTKSYRTVTPQRFKTFLVPVTACTSAGATTTRLSLFRPPIRIPDIFISNLEASAELQNCKNAYPKFWRLLLLGRWNLRYLPLNPRSCTQSRTSCGVHRHGIFFTITVQTPSSNE